jgi:formylglycine-generating enzyme required for sulfatase activity
MLPRAWFRLVLLLGVLIGLGLLPGWTKAPAPIGRKQPKEITNSVGLKLARIPAGRFLMGSPREEKDRDKDEEQHDVEITKLFFLGVHEVTQKQFKTVMGYNPSFFSTDGKGKAGVDYGSVKPAGGKDKVKQLASTDDFPVENVSWEEAMAFLTKLSDLPEEKKNGRKYRLPTEAEWGYACRGATGGDRPFHFGDSRSSTQANFDGNYPSGRADKGPSLERTNLVGSYKGPNKFGLMDMHGNVYEWCSDWFGSDYYGKSPKADPQGPSEGATRVIRGGSWSDSGRNCRAAFRCGKSPSFRHWYLGFRVVAVPLK